MASSSTSSARCCSCSCFGTWVGTIMFHAAVIGAIAFCVRDVWPVGLCLSIAYSALLFWSTPRLHRRWYLDQSRGEPRFTDDSSCPEDSTASETNQDSTGGEDGPIREHRSTDGLAREGSPTASSGVSFPLLISILYVLCILSVGVPGAILIFNVIPCEEMPNWQTSYWEVDYTELPFEVQDWDENGIDQYGVGRYYGGYSYNTLKLASDGFFTFVQVQNTTYFPGVIQDSPPMLVAVEGSDPARVVYRDKKNLTAGIFYEAQWITKMDEESMCFVSFMDDDEDVRDIYNAVQTPLISCGNEDGFKHLRMMMSDELTRLKNINGLLWYWKRTALPGSIMGDYYSRAGMRVVGHAIVSLNTSTMEETTHSTIHSPDTYVESLTCSTSFSAGRLLGILLLSSLPVTFVSAWLWMKRAIPSSSVTLYAGVALSWVFLMSLLSIGSYTISIEIMFGTVVWNILVAYQLSVNPRISKGPLVWSLYTLGTGIFVFFALSLVRLGMDARYGFIDLGEDAAFALGWVFLGFLPLVLVSLIVCSAYFYLLAVLSVMMVLSFVVVLGTRAVAMTGRLTIVGMVCLIVAIVAFCIYQKWARLHKWTMAKILPVARHVCAVRQEDDLQEVTELLHNQSAEMA